VIRKLILLLFLAVPMAAQDAQLFIERIEVRNHKRVSPDVVIAESRLREGHVYSEADLRDAAARLGRLPFLLSVDFALEKGSERGKHVLVLTLHETRPFFFLLDVQPYLDEEDGPITADTDNRNTSGGETLALGFRWFVGRRGAVHVGFSGVERNREFSREYASLEAGYTQYDLFGTRAFATLNLKRPVEPYGGARVSPQVVVGVPLSENQTLTLQYDEARFRSESRSFESGYSQRLLSARWSLNTTNEPFFPTRGMLIYAGPVIGWTDGASIGDINRGTPAGATNHSRFAGVETGAARYFELSERNSAWGDVRADWSRGQFRSTLSPEGFDRTSHYVSLGVGYSHSLWSREERANGDSRFEWTARYANRTRRYYEDLPGFDAPSVDVRQVGWAWLRRTSWGTLRLGVGYAW
jgi:outer membrane protein assembly factor BamA